MNNILLYTYKLNNAKLYETANMTKNGEALKIITALSISQYFHHQIGQIQIQPYFSNAQLLLI